MNEFVTSYKKYIIISCGAIAIVASGYIGYVIYQSYSNSANKKVEGSKTSEETGSDMSGHSTQDIIKTRNNSISTQNKDKTLNKVKNDNIKIDANDTSNNDKINANLTKTDVDNGPDKKIEIKSENQVAAAHQTLVAQNKPDTAANTKNKQTDINKENLNAGKVINNGKENKAGNTNVDKTNKEIIKSENPIKSTNQKYATKENFFSKFNPNGDNQISTTQNTPNADEIKLHTSDPISKENIAKKDVANNRIQKKVSEDNNKTKNEYWESTFNIGNAIKNGMTTVREQIKTDDVKNVAGAFSSVFLIYKVGGWCLQGVYSGLSSIFGLFF